MYKVHFRTSSISWEYRSTWYICRSLGEG